MSALNAKKRNALPSSDFALKGRHYPVDTENRARSALSRVSHNGSPAEKAKVRRKVHSKYPGIAVSGIKGGKKKHGQQRKRVRR